MIRNEIYIAFGIVALLLSCGSESDIASEEKLQKEIFEVVAVEDSASVVESVSKIVDGSVNYNLVTADYDTSVLTVEYMYYEITDAPYRDSVNSFILELFTPSEYESMPWVADELSPGMFEGFLESFGETYYDYSMDDPEAVAWSLEQRLSIVESSSSLVQLNYSGWSYEGGAHGGGFDNWFVFDKESGGRLKLSDFFNNISVLTTIGEKYFKEQNLQEENQTLDEAGYEFGEDGFYLNDNFYFGGDALNFYYGSYEIGPYAMPPSEIAIPLTEIQHLLKREI